MNRRRLDGIAPAAESPFGDCTYPIRFSVLRYFARPIEVVALNVHHRLAWALDSQLDTPILFFTNHTILDPDQALERVGISARGERLDHASVIPATRTALERGRPVMVAVDRFHQATAHNYYHKTHHLHFVLACGYDDTAQTISLLDDSVGGDSWTIEHTVMASEDLARAHASCTRLWPRELAKLTTFTEFEADGRRLLNDRVVADCQQAFVADMLMHEPALRQGPAHLVEFREACAAAGPVTIEGVQVYQRMFRRQVELARTRLWQSDMLGVPQDLANDLRAAGARLERVWHGLFLTSTRAQMRANPAKLGQYRDQLLQQLSQAERHESEFLDTWFEAVASATCDTSRGQARPHDSTAR